MFALSLANLQSQAMTITRLKVQKAMAGFVNEKHLELMRVWMNIIDVGWQRKSLEIYEREKRNKEENKKKLWCDRKGVERRRFIQLSSRFPVNKIENLSRAD